MLEDLFGDVGHVSAAQECARAAVVFLCGLLFVRLAGRRVFSEWSALDIIVAIVVGSNLSRALTGSAELGGTLAATALTMVLHWILARSSARWPTVSRVVEGACVPLGEDGHVDIGKLKRHNVSEADLQEALRSAGIESPTLAHRIVLEPSGRIAVLKDRHR